MVDSIITKSNGRDKVIDFRDGLVAANIDDYANLHGVGGNKGKAPVSVIKTYICDYTKGKGEKSLTVNASISPDLCEQLLEICKQNLGTTIIDPSLSVLTEQRAVNRKLSKTADMIFGLTNNILTILNRIKEKDKAPALQALATGMSNLFTKTRDAAATKDDSLAQSPIQIARHCDFNYIQDRVHAFGENIHEGSIVPVQRLNIFRQTYRNDGQMSKYPWTVKITNAKAPVHFQDTGATSFSSAKMTDKQEAFIMLSDADMYRMMSRICHFITAWECSVGADVIRQGRKNRAEERAAARQNAA